MGKGTRYIGLMPWDQYQDPTRWQGRKDSPELPSVLWPSQAHCGYLCTYVHTHTRKHTIFKTGNKRTDVSYYSLTHLKLQPGIFVANHLAALDNALHSLLWERHRQPHSCAHPNSRATGGGKQPLVVLCHAWAQLLASHLSVWNKLGSWLLLGHQRLIFSGVLA